MLDSFCCLLIAFNLSKEPIFLLLTAVNYTQPHLLCQSPMVSVIFRHWQEIKALIHGGLPHQMTGKHAGCR